MSEKDAPVHSWLMERRYFSLIIVLVFVILAAAAFYICHRHHTINTEQTLKEDRSTANLLSLVLDERLKKIVSVMESYSNRPLLLQAAKDKNVEKVSKHLISLVKSNPDIDFVVISDRWGTPWAASYPGPSPVTGKNFAHRDWYKGVSKEWKPYISDVVLRVVKEKDIAIQISVPCISEKGEVIGILVNTQRTVGLNRLFKPVPLDSGTFVTVTDRKGQIIYSNQRDVETEIRPYPFHAGMKKALAAKNNTFPVDDPDYGGKRRYISFAPVVNFGWTVFVERGRRSILLSESEYFIQVTAIAFLLFLSVILFLFYSRKQVMAQKIMEQLRAEKRIRTGEETLRALSLRQEAILTATPNFIMEVDHNKIYTWANPAGLDFFGEDVIGREAADYFEGEQNTYDVVQPLFKGDESTIYLESWQRRKDGQKRLLGWWCRVLKDEKGNVRGALSSAYDITDNRQKEEEVIQTAREWQTTFDATSDSIWILDKDQRVLRSNSAAERILGRPMEAFIGKHCWEIVHGTNQPIPECPILRTKHSLRRETMELQIGDAWFEVAVDPILSADGQYAGAVHIVSDITERKQAEEAVKQGEEKFRNLFDNAIEGVYQTTPEGRLITANMAFARMFGYESPEEIINAVTDLASQMYANPDDRKIAVGIFRETGHLKDFECRMRRRDGSIFWARYDGRFTKTQDGKPCFQGFIIDITERKRLDVALSESEQRFRGIVENASDLVYEMTTEGIFTYLSPNWMELIGEPAAEAVGKSCEPYVHPDDVPAIREFLDRIHDTGWATSVDYRGLHGDGSIRWFFAKGSALRDRDGNVVGSLGIARDITDRKRAEEEIHRLNDELEQRVIDRTAQLEAVNKELEAFSYSVSHDLRAPLRSIDGFSQALLEEYPGKPLDDTGKTYLERVRKATQKMGFLIDDMLKLSRVSRTEFNSEAVDLSGMVRAIVEAHQKNNPERVVNVTVQEGVMVQGDPYMMKIVLENLMDNAWKFTGKEAHPRIEFGTTARDKKTVCFIRDNGAGFDMAYVSKLFGAFQRLHTTDQFPGTGIGLSTVQRIIHRHGGQVWAEGGIGKGATFYFTLRET